MNITSQKQVINKQGNPIISIPSNIFGNFYLLHTKFKNLEWSGWIFYNTVGSLENPDTMCINITDFILLDIGSGAFTSIEPTGEQIANIYIDRPHLMGMQYGILHTHHSMSLFFSGTDTDTLLNCANQFDFLLSVIVNHKDHPIAKISQAGEIEALETFKYKFKGSQVYKEPVKVNKEVVLVWDCKVVIENNDIRSELEICERIYKETQERISKQHSSFVGFNRPISSIKNESWDWEKPHGYDEYLKTRKTFNPVQTNLFEDTEISGVDPIYSKLSIKEKTIELLKMCLLQMQFTENHTLAQAREEYNTSKQELQYSLKELKLETEDCLDEYFEVLFTNEELGNVNNVKEIETHLDIIKDSNSKDECLIVSVIKKYLEPIL
jgi:hypothetical protein